MPRDRKPSKAPVDLARARAALDRLDALPLPRTAAGRARLAAYLETLETDTMSPPRPPKDPEKVMAKQTAIRLTKEDHERCGALAEAMQLDTGLVVTRSGAMRAALTAGLDALEEKYGLAPKRRARKG